jgi:outer membrane protein assembly factor BamB
MDSRRAGRELSTRVKPRQGAGHEQRGSERLGVIHHNRGIGFWNGTVFAATWDERLIAIDALTGKEVWRANTVDPDEPLYITVAPKVFKGNPGREC